MSKSPDTETVDRDPWDVAIPYMKGGFEESAKLYNEYTPEYYSGQTQAGFSLLNPAVAEASTEDSVTGFRLDSASRVIRHHFTGTRHHIR